MRKSLIAGAILIPIGMFMSTGPALGPTLASRSLEREGLTLMTPADACAAENERSVMVGTYNIFAFSSAEYISVCRGESGSDICIPGPECGTADSEVLLFPEGNGVFLRCRARSALGLLTPQERGDLLAGLAALFLGVFLVVGSPLRDALARRRWDAIEDQPATSG